MTSSETEPPNASPAPSIENLMTSPEEVQASLSSSSVSQSQHRSSLAEWITAAFTVVLALSTLALVVTAIYQHIDALDSIQAITGIARTGEKLFVAGQRAWVSCHVVMDEDLTYDENGARFILGCILNNTGHSPARKVFFYASAFPNIGFDHHTEQNRACAKAELQRVGSDVFPGEPLGSGTGTYISIDTINEIRKTFRNNVALITPFLVTCIGYKIVGDDRYHHTPRIFMLTRGNKAINVDDGTVPKSELTLKIWPMEESDAD